MKPDPQSYRRIQYIKLGSGGLQPHAVGGWYINPRAIIQIILEY